MSLFDPFLVALYAPQAYANVGEAVEEPEPEIDVTHSYWLPLYLQRPVALRRRTVQASSDLYTAHPNVSWTEVSIYAQVSMMTHRGERIDLGVVGQVDGIIRTLATLQLLDRFDVQGHRYAVTSRPVEQRDPLTGELMYRRAAFQRIELEEG